MWGGFDPVPGRCRGLQGLAGASKGLQGPQEARLKFHAGWSGWTRPPTMGGRAAGGGGVGQAEACL